MKMIAKMHCCVTLKSKKRNEMTGGCYQIYTADQMITGDGVTVIPQGAVRVDSNGTILAAGTREELTRQFPEEKVLAFNGCSLLP